MQLLQSVKVGGGHSGSYTEDHVCKRSDLVKASANRKMPALSQESNYLYLKSIFHASNSMKFSQRFIAIILLVLISPLGLVLLFQDDLVTLTGRTNANITECVNNLSLMDSLGPIGSKLTAKEVCMIYDKTIKESTWEPDEVVPHMIHQSWKDEYLPVEFRRWYVLEFLRLIAP